MRRFRWRCSRPVWGRRWTTATWWARWRRGRRGAGRGGGADALVGVVRGAARLTGEHAVGSGEPPLFCKRLGDDRGLAAADERDAGAAGEYGLAVDRRA